MALVQDEEPGFWPGYVAAVSGLVQGLLIMAMALGVAIYALGQLSQAKRAAPLEPARRAPAASGQAPAGFAREARLPLPAPVPPVGLSGPAPTPAPIPAVREGDPAPIQAGFAGDAVILPTSAVPGLIASLYRAGGAGVTRWRITIPADVSDPREQRAAYLRLLGLRALLVRHGIAPSAIDLWIDAGAPAVGGAGRVARIEPAPEAPAGPAAPAGDRP